MRTKVDRINKVVIASGSYRGKKLRAIAVCKEDIFDESFGLELAKRKYKVKERYAKLRYHDSCIKKLNKQMEMIKKEIEDHEKCSNYLDRKIMEEIDSCENFVENYFNK